jgi:UDP-N-acetylmuramoyl-tripeptide--D-alanyl-D-alanine ligase
MTSGNGTASDLTLVFGGDTSLGDAYLGRTGSSETLGRLASCPLGFFEKLEPLIADKDRFLLNLETVLSDQPGAPVHEGKRCCGSDAQERTIGVLTAIGVDAVSLANNHAMDFGADRLCATVALLRKAGINVLGAGECLAQAAEPWRMSSSLGNIYVLAGFELRKKYKKLYRFYAEEGRPGVNGFELKQHNRLATAIGLIRNRDPEAFIIAFVHWGDSANYGPPSGPVWDANEGFLEAGADLVLGHGSHNLQQCLASPVGTTVFSLGNLVFNSPGRYGKLSASPFSAVGRLELGCSGGGRTATLKLYPILSDNRQTRYRPRPVTETEAREVFSILSSDGRHDFGRAFELDHDHRGWYVARTATLGGRLACSTKRSDKDRVELSSRGRNHGRTSAVSKEHSNSPPKR